MSDFGTNSGLSNLANKQYAIARQAQKPAQKPVEDLNAGKIAKGQISAEQTLDMTNPQVITQMEALAMQEEISKKKKLINSHTVEDMKERFEKALSDKYDNAHNMLAEAFHSFRAGAASTMLNVLGADATEIEEIKKKAYDQAKKKVHAGFERLASAYAEYEIYAS